MKTFDFLNNKDLLKNVNSFSFSNLFKFAFKNLFGIAGDKHQVTHIDTQLATKQEKVELPKYLWI